MGINKIYNILLSQNWIKRVKAIKNYYTSILKIKDKSEIKIIILIIKTLLYKQYILKLNIENKGVLFSFKTIYNNFKGNKEEGSKDKFDKNKIEFVRLLEKIIILDKVE